MTGKRDKDIKGRRDVIGAERRTEKEDHIWLHAARLHSKSVFLDLSSLDQQHYHYKVWPAELLQQSQHPKPVRRAVTL